MGVLNNPQRPDAEVLACIDTRGDKLAAALASPSLVMWLRLTTWTAVYGLVPVSVALTVLVSPRLTSMCMTSWLLLLWRPVKPSTASILSFMLLVATLHPLPMWILSLLDRDWSLSSTIVTLLLGTVLIRLGQQGARKEVPDA